MSRTAEYMAMGDLDEEGLVPILRLLQVVLLEKVRDFNILLRQADSLKFRTYSFSKFSD